MFAVRPRKLPLNPLVGEFENRQTARFHGPLAAKPGHTSMAPRRKGVGTHFCAPKGALYGLLGFRHPEATRDRPRVRITIFVASL
jgi:hypothetical protein